MSKRKRPDWKMQLVTIYNKGRQACAKGLGRTRCPYLSGYRNANGPGGSLQRQRREAWLDGWDAALREGLHNTQKETP